MKLATKVMIAFIAISVLTAAVFIIKNDHKSDALKNSYVKMARMTVYVMQSDIKRSAANDYKDWDDDSDGLDYLLSNLEGGKDLGLGEYKDVCALINQVSNINVVNSKQKAFLKKVAKMKFSIAVGGKEQYIKFSDPDDKKLINMLSYRGMW